MQPFKSPHHNAPAFSSPRSIFRGDFLQPLFQIRLSIQHGQRSGIFPKKFKNKITDKRRNHGNSKISLAENISDCPSKALYAPQTRACKLSHQEIGIKEEDYKTNLDYGAPDILFHSCTLIFTEPMIKGFRLLWKLPMPLENPVFKFRPPPNTLYYACTSELFGVALSVQAQRISPKRRSFLCRESLTQ